MTLGQFVKKLRQTRKWLNWSLDATGCMRSTLKPEVFKIALHSGPKLNGVLAQSLVERVQESITGENFCPLSAAAYLFRGDLLSVEDVEGTNAGLSNEDGRLVIDAADKNFSKPRQKDYGEVYEAALERWQAHSKLRKAMLKAVGLREQKQERAV
jgi:hypothetical protein